MTEVRDSLTLDVQRCQFFGEDNPFIYDVPDNGEFVQLRRVIGIRMHDYICFSSDEVGQRKLNDFAEASHAQLMAENQRLREALRQITESMGRYDHDPYRHAINTIEDMRDVAWAALQTTEEK